MVEGHSTSRLYLLGYSVRERERECVCVFRTRNKVDRAVAYATRGMILSRASLQPLYVCRLYTLFTTYFTTDNFGFRYLLAEEEEEEAEKQANTPNMHCHTSNHPLTAPQYRDAGPPNSA